MAGWSVPGIIAFICALMIGFHLLASLIGYWVNVLTIRVGLHGLMRLRRRGCP